MKNFAKSYYTWNNSKEAIEARTQTINGYLTKELQDLNIDTIRTDIPTSSTVTDVIVWSIEQSGTDTFSATYEVDQQIKDGDEKAIEKILAFYDPYISKCCLRPLYDEYGNVYIVVDMELKGLIREALIKMILGFDIALEIEEE